MPRRKATATTEATSPETSTIDPPHTPESPPLPVAEEHGRAGGTQERAAFDQNTVSLGAAKDSPKMHLARSPRFRQMQIRSDEPLSEKHQDMLKDAGWKDRTEEEGIWTKQIPKDSGWQPQADAERLFKQIANEIRGDRKLEPVLSR